MKFKFLLLSVFTFSLLNTFATCPSGIIDETVWGTPNDYDFGFTSDDDPVGLDTIQVTQGVDTTIYIQYLLPLLQDITEPISTTATINSVQVLGVTGLPIGMGWQVDAAAAADNNTYYPQAYRYGVVTVCGETFSNPGVKTVTVTVYACGSAAGQTACQNTTFPLYIEVLPGSGGNSGFTLSPNIGCNNIDVEFEAIFESADPVLYPIDYIWDLGDGTSGTGQFITNDYNSGIYGIHLDANINEYYISEVSLSNITSASDLFGEVDVYGVFNATTLEEIGNDNTPSWEVEIPLTGYQLDCIFTDADNPPIDEDDEIGSHSYALSATDLYDGNQIDYNAGGFWVTVIINKRVASIVPFDDTVSVYSNSTASITSSNGTQFCNGDSTILSLGTAPFDYIQWYNDTTILFGENNNDLIVKTAGDYYALIVDSGNICEGTTSTTTIITEFVAPAEISQNASGLAVSNSDGYTVQWFSNNVPIPGANGNSITDVSSGNPFTVSFTNTNGCTSLSEDFNAAIAGTSTQTGSSLSDSESMTFTANDFNLCPGQEIAWAVSLQSDGPITDVTELQTSIDNGWVYPSTGVNTFDANCSTTEFPPGDYYMTPVSVDAVVIDPVYWNSSTAEGYCDATMEICITLTGTDYSINPLEIILPNGTTIDVLGELAGLPDVSINPVLWDAATDTTDGILCIDLIKELAYYENPNGNWVIKVPNSGSGDLGFLVETFNIVVDAANCDMITTNQIIAMPEINSTVEAGETGEASNFTIIVPPFPSDFPNITPDCVLFGDATTFSSTCVLGIEDLIDITQLKLYPNPNNGSFQLEFMVSEKNDINITIFDISGRSVVQKAYNNIIGDFNENYNFNELNTGFYFMNIEVGNFNIQKKFIIK